ncbi:hypothetical protein P7K49_036068 [Saguinus oedipus]|uniref:Uncharacterized protein n=1 Tax=Saguinus oedipus TaxID=9490 RepID=A0ABQ9TPF3_SAGOE|nr:hypothetical protein P7K49_036068 [Saguinus oedipus]
MWKGTLNYLRKTNLCLNQQKPSQRKVTECSQKRQRLFRNSLQLRSTTPIQTAKPIMLRESSLHLKLFEEMLQEKLKVPESENNKTSNSSQVSNEQHKTDAYKLLKKEMTLDLKTKFGSTADALISDDETTRLVTSLEDDFDEDLDAEA